MIGVAAADVEIVDPPVEWTFTDPQFFEDCGGKVRSVVPFGVGKRDHRPAFR
jgi:hypothetical protein